MKPTTFEEYEAQFPENVKEKLREIREIIAKAAPNATETISYGMPAFKQTRLLLYFAAWKNHIGFYPTSSGIARFTKEFSEYKTSKGAVQFPYDKPLPKHLIERVTRFRVNEVNKTKKL
ncbi:MAG: iron chaperone [Pyrinomonadaceae bacterium]